MTPLNKMNARDLLEKARVEAKARIESGGPRLLSPAPVFNKAEDEATVYLYDVIDSWWGIDSGQFVKDLNAITAKTIHLRINSPGGSVFDAEAIQTALQQHKARVVAHIDGMAASAATYVALAADEVEMSDGAMFMIHNAWTFAFGNASELVDTAALLEKIDANLLRDYQAKTGASAEQIKQWMDAETWFNAEEALTNGFVDRIFTADKADDDKTPDENKENSDKTEKNTNNSAENMAAQAAHARRQRELALVSAGI